MEYDGLFFIYDVTDAEWLRSVRSMSQEDVDRTEGERDRARGLYVPHGGVVHHGEAESAH